MVTCKALLGGWQTDAAQDGAGTPHRIGQEWGLGSRPHGVRGQAHQGVAWAHLHWNSQGITSAAVHVGLWASYRPLASARQARGGLVVASYSRGHVLTLGMPKSRPAETHNVISSPNTGAGGTQVGPKQSLHSNHPAFSYSKGPHLVRVGSWHRGYPTAQSCHPWARQQALQRRGQQAAISAQVTTVPDEGTCTGSRSRIFVVKRPDCAPAKPKGSAVSFVKDVHRPTVCGLQYLSGLQRSKHRPHAVLQSIVCYSGGLGHCHGAGPRNLAQHILQQPRTVPVRGSQKFA